MFTLKQSGPAAGDRTIPYDVILDREYTVGTFIDAVLSQDAEGFGYIGIDNGHTCVGNPRCEYALGVLRDNRLGPDDLKKEVVSVKANGVITVSNMCYLIQVKE